MNVGHDETLRVLFWESTTRCNLNCAHCSRVDLDQSGDQELTTDEVRGVLESARSLGRPIIILSGGEPLLRDDWEEIIAHTGSLGLPAAMATNGTLIDSPLADRIAAAGLSRTAVSLDGSEAGVHDEFRGVRGSFQRAVDGIRALVSRGVSVQVNATIAAHNFEQIDAIYELSRSLGAIALHLFILVPVGCGAKIEKSHRLTDEQYLGVLRWAARNTHRGDLEFRVTCGPHYHRIIAQDGSGATAKPKQARVSSRGCLAGLSVLFVAHDGQVFPCGYLPVGCGSVRESSLVEIWRESEVLRELRNFDKLKGACGRCEYRTICGGCRARAFARTADYLSEDPSCPYR